MNRNFPTRKEAFLFAMCLSPIIFAAAYFGHASEGLGIFVCTGMVGFAAKQYWDLRRDYRYWSVLVFGVLIQIPLVLFFPWDAKGMSYPKLLPIGLADYAVLWAGLSFVKRNGH